jgi:hypothetical protein
MHDLENEIKELLVERSHDIDLDPRIPAGVIRRSHRRRVLTASAVGLGAAALALVVVAGVRALPSEDSKPRPAETPNPLHEEMPSSFVGVKDGELVLASTETGEVLRVIADRSVIGTDDSEDGIDLHGLALTPDRSTVYFSAIHIRPGGEERRLARVPLEGGEPEDLGMGFDPGVSSDGDRLAYQGGCTESGCGGALVVLNLRTEEKTRVDVSEAELTVGDTVWLPDGRLVLELVPTPMDVGRRPYEYRVIDPARPPAKLIDAPSVPTARGTKTFGLYGYHPLTGGVVRGEERRRDQPVRFVSVDPDTGEVLGTVVRGSWWEVHPDASGLHLLLLDFGDGVHISRDGGKPQLIAEGFSDVAW